MPHLPTLFLSHGSPMHAIEPGRAGAAWRSIATGLPRTSLPMITGGDRHDTIHDFSGFPAPLYQLRYDAPGAPAVATRIASLLRDAGYTPALNSCRGLDHGAWVPLRWMYPEADIPVLQLSVQTTLGPAHHLQLGEALSSLGDDAVLVIGSGHVTHNLRDWMTHRRDPAPLEYVSGFSEWLHDRLLAGDRDAVLGYRSAAPSAARAHPTEEHFLPLFVAWGAAGRDARPSRVYSAIEDGALSMDAYRFD